MLPMIGVLTAGAVAWWKYVYAAGAACYLVAKFFTPYTGSHPRVKRLMRIESWAFTLAGGALLIFTSLSIPRTISKELRRSQEAKTRKK